MSLMFRHSCSALLALVLGLSSAVAQPISALENFDDSNENWKNSLSNLTEDATWVSGGGPNGASDAFIRSTFTTPGSSAQVVFRARNTVNSSDNVFFGNWIAGDVWLVDFWFRHDAPNPISLVGLRLPTAAGFPAMLGRFPDPVQPNVWTRLSMEINNTNPELLDETGPTHNNFNAVFSNVTSIQIFADLTGQPGATAINFDLDHFTVLPEPSTWLMACIGLPATVLAARYRRRKAQRLKRGASSAA